MMIDFSVEDKRNTFGVHDNGAIKIFLCNFNFKDNIPKIIEIIEHEVMHYAIRKCLKPQDQEWANQERIIGKIMLTKRA